MLLPASLGCQDNRYALPHQVFWLPTSLCLPLYSLLCSPGIFHQAVYIHCQSSHLFPLSLVPIQMNFYAKHSTRARSLNAVILTRFVFVFHLHYIELIRNMLPHCALSLTLGECKDLVIFKVNLLNYPFPRPRLKILEKSRAQSSALFPSLPLASAMISPSVIFKMPSICHGLPNLFLFPKPNTRPCCNRVFEQEDGSLQVCTSYQ